MAENKSAADIVRERLQAASPGSDGSALEKGRAAEQRKIQARATELYSEIEFPDELDYRHCMNQAVRENEVARRQKLEHARDAAAKESYENAQRLASKTLYEQYEASGDKAHNEANKTPGEARVLDRLMKQLSGVREDAQESEED